MDNSVLDRACHGGQLVGGGPGDSDGTPAPIFGLTIGMADVPVCANLVAHSSYWPSANTPFSNVNVAVDNWNCPTTDFALALSDIEVLRGPNGETYPIRFVGSATLGTGANCSITQFKYDAATNVTTALLSVPANEFNPFVNFYNTRRLPSDTTATGIDARTLTIMRPLAPGSDQHHDPSERWNRQLIPALAPWKGGHVRDLDSGYVNNVPDAPPLTPANRTMPFSPIQSVVGPPTRGWSFEYRIQLANFLGMGLWTNFPDTGTPELFQLYLNIVKYGSDATGNPYTGTTGSNPVQPGQEINPPLAGAWHWEEGNENWNLDFAQYGRYAQRGSNTRAQMNVYGEITGTDANGKPYTDPGGSNPPPAGTPDPLDPLFCRPVADLIEHADMAKATFPGGFGVKYFPTFCTQAGQSLSRHGGLTWLQRHLAARGETVAQNVASVGGDGYESLLVNVGDSSQTVDSVIAGGVQPSPGIPADATFAIIDSVPYSSYECGLYSEDNALGFAVAADPRFGLLVRDRALNMVAVGCKYITLYALIRGKWSVLKSIHDLSDPRWLGWAEAIAHYPMDGRTPVPLPTPSAPFLADGSFETFRLGARTTEYTFQPPGTAWTYQSSAGISGQVNGFVNQGQPIPIGTQVCFLQSTSSISQVVPGWASSSYQITGLMNGRLNQDPTIPFDILVDGVVVGTFAPPGVQYFAQFATNPFKVSAGTHTVTFRTTSQMDRSILLDALSIRPATAVKPISVQSRNGTAAGIVSIIGKVAY